MPPWKAKKSTPLFCPEDVSKLCTTSSSTWLPRFYYLGTVSQPSGFEPLGPVVSHHPVVSTLTLTLQSPDSFDLEQNIAFLGEVGVGRYRGR